MINLIGLSGYAGSGKSTVGTIIQYLTTDKKGISYSGSYNSYIMDIGMGSKPSSIWEVKGFATKLKKIASLLTGIPEHKFDDPEFKKGFLPKEWNIHHFVGKGGGTAVLPKYGGEIQERQMSVREFLQKLGTDAVRNVLGEDVWVNALFADYKKQVFTTGVHGYDDSWIQTEGDWPNWIVTDCRFPNEAHAIKDRGGIMIRVDRNVPVGTHLSETSLDHWKFDYILYNTGTIEELVKKTKEMLQHFKLIT